MNTKLIYRVLSGVYDLLDVIYFRDEQHSPRTAVLKKINENDIVLDLCTGTATNALSIARKKPGTKIVGVDLSKDMLKVADEKRKKSGLRNVKLYKMDATALKFKSGCFDKILFAPIQFLEPKPYKSFVRKDLYEYFSQFGLEIASYEHCDYTKVVVLKKS